MKQKNMKKGGFLRILLGTLSATLLGNRLTGQGAIATSQGRGTIGAAKGTIRVGEGRIRAGQDF